MFETPKCAQRRKLRKLRKRRKSKTRHSPFHYSPVISNATSQRASIKNTTAERMDCTTSTSSTKKNLHCSLCSSFRCQRRQVYHVTFPSSSLSEAQKIKVKSIST